MKTLPFLTEDLPGLPGLLRTVDDDFLVDELPAYEPCGSGEHLYLRFEKRGLTTHEAIRRICRALDVDPRAAGVAGLKDRHAVTRQWMSIPCRDDARARALGEGVEGVRILTISRHVNKLRTGHLRGNRFVLRLRGVPEGREPEAAVVLARLAREGVPNYYGEQRFGRDARNAADARRFIVDGERPPRDPFRRKLLVSALQAELFNEVLAARVADGLLARAIDGDLLRKEDTGGLFTTDDHADAETRVATFEVSATGPMFGARMRWPEREARAREETVLRAAGLSEAHLERFARDGEGTRRPLRIRPTDAEAEVAAPGEVVLRFTLPKGAYATVLVREITKAEPELAATPGAGDDAVTGDPPPSPDAD